MRYILLVVSALFAVGCNPNKETSTEAADSGAQTMTQTQSQSQTQSQGTGDGNSTVMPMAPSAGGLSPVTNSDSVVGGGGEGVGAAAKERARRVQAPSSGASEEGSGE